LPWKSSKQNVRVRILVFIKFHANRTFSAPYYTIMKDPPRLSLHCMPYTVINHGGHKWEKWPDVQTR